MEGLRVRTQQELDAVPVDYNGRITIKFGTKSNPAILRKRYKYPAVLLGSSNAVLRGSSSAVLRESSRAELWESSHAELWESSHAELWESSSAVLRGSSSAVLRESSRAELWESSRAELWESSSAVLWGNAQALDKSHNCNIQTHGNSRIVYDPRNIEEYIDKNGLICAQSNVLLYKAVHKRDGRYWADWTDFEYKIGEVAEADSLTTDVTEDCGHGIHMAYKAWCVVYGSGWHDLAILELEVEKAGVIVPLYGRGKVRAAKATVVREVPLEECGLHGEWLAKERGEHG